MFKRLFKNKAIVIQTISICIFLFVGLILTYALTTRTFNPYVVSFKRTFKSEFTSIVGNISILSIICLIVFIFIRRPYRRIYTLGIIMILLTILIYALRVYSRYYFVLFSFHQMSLVRNPAGELGANVALQVLAEFFTTGMFVFILPGIAFIVLPIVFRKRQILNDRRESHTTPKKVASILLAISLSFGMVLSFRRSVKNKWPYNSDLAMYGCENLGVYNYYFHEALGWNFYYSGKKDYKQEEVTVLVKEFDRNESTYTNFLDSTNSNSHDYVGLFEGKSLKIIQLESVNTYCVNLKLEDGSLLMPNLNRIINDDASFYFKNFYTSAGQGKTADAELAVNTGVNVQGQNTLHWDYKYKKNNYSYQTLADMFKEKYSSTCYSFHGDLEAFYNREIVHEYLFGYDEFYSLEDYLKTHKTEKEDPDSYINGWVDDKVVLDWEEEVTKDLTTPFLSYSIMTISHTPFKGNPKEKEYDFGYKNKMLNRYLAYMRYVDDYLGDLYTQMKNDTDSIYLIYGDHGSFLTNSEMKELFGKQSIIDSALNNLKVPALIFDGSNSLYLATSGVMETNLVRSQTDLFTTVVDLFNLDYRGVRLGVNGLTNEKTFYYDPNNLTIITDNYIYYTKKKSYRFFNEYDKETMLDEVEKVKTYKLVIDMANRYNLLSKED